MHKDKGVKILKISSLSKDFLKVSENNTGHTALSFSGCVCSAPACRSLNSSLLGDSCSYLKEGITSLVQFGTGSF